MFQEMLSNKLFVTLAALTVFNVVLVLGGNYALDRTADRVVERLEKNYSPSPYGPGFDPDKVEPAVKGFMMQTHDQGTQVAFEAVSSVDSALEPAQFDVAWEAERGFTP